MSEPSRAAVPDHPVVVVLEGDGIGPEVLASARQVLDAATGRLYRKQRTIDWRLVPSGSANSLLPDETVAALREHRTALRGPFAAPDEGGQSRALELGGLLDVFVGEIRLRDDAREIVLLLEASEGSAAPAEAAPVEPETDALLRLVRREVPSVATAIRFGTRERVESYLRAVGRPEPALVETGLGVELISREGTERFIGASLALAEREQRRRVTLVVDPSATPHAAEFFADTAYRVASERFPGVAVTHPDFMRATVRASEAVAAALRDRALEAGLWIEQRSLAEACELADRRGSFDVVCAPWAEGLLLAHLLAGEDAATTAVVRSNPETGAVIGETLHGTAAALKGKDRANPTAAIRAGARVLWTLGWTEMPAAIEAAINQALAPGTLPSKRKSSADAKAAAGTGPAKLQGSAFTQAVIAALAR